MEKELKIRDGDENVVFVIPLPADIKDPGPSTAVLLDDVKLREYYYNSMARVQLNRKRAESNADFQARALRWKQAIFQAEGLEWPQRW